MQNVVPYKTPSFVKYYSFFVSINILIYTTLPLSLHSHCITFYDNESVQNKKLFVLIYSYGGPGSQLVCDRWKMGMNHVMASGKSYIVLEIDGAGTGGQGEARKMEVKYKLGQLEVQDQLDAIQYDYLLFNYLKNLKLHLYYDVIEHI